MYILLRERVILEMCHTNKKEVLSYYATGIVFSFLGRTILIRSSSGYWLPLPEIKITFKVNIYTYTYPLQWFSNVYFTLASTTMAVRGQTNSTELDHRVFSKATAKVAPGLTLTSQERRICPFEGTTCARSILHELWGNSSNNTRPLRPVAFMKPCHKNKNIAFM